MTLGGLCGRQEALRLTPRESVHGTAPPLEPFGMYGSRLNVTLRDDRSVVLPVDAIPKEGGTGCGIQDIDDHQFKNCCQAIILKRKSRLYNHSTP